MWKSDSIVPNLQGSTLFQWLLKCISWWGLSKKWVITVSEGKCTLI